MPSMLPPQESFSFHDWKNPNHYRNCLRCRADRVCMFKSALETAHNNAEAAARYTGQSARGRHYVLNPRAGPREVRVPGSSQTVTIQLPYMRSSVAPHLQDPFLRPRKRTFNLFDESVIDSIYNREPERSKNTRSLFPHPSFRYRLDPNFHPLLLSQPESPLAPAEPKPITESIPGAWPSWADDQSTSDDLTAVMTFTTKIGANIWGTVSSIFGATSTLCNTLSQRFRQPRVQTHAETTSITGPAAKRRRLDDDESFIPGIGTRESPIEISELMDIVNDIEPAYPAASYTPSYALNYETTSDEDEKEEPEPPVTRQDVSPRSGVVASASTAAAQRAVRLFPSKNRQTTSSQLVTPPTSDDELSATKPEAASEVVNKPLPQSQYKDILDFFENEDQHSLPGLERSRLCPNRFKICELDSQRQEREDALEALRLRPLGLRKPRQLLIADLASDWDRRARAAPMYGRITASKWKNQPHPDSVPLAPKDFGRMVPESAWLNDDAIHATLVCLATYINDAAGVTPKKSVPKCVALSSLYWSSFCQDEKKLYPRPFNRKWGMNPDNFLGIETVLIPVNLGNHWTLLVVRPSRRTVSYCDSFHSNGQRQLEHAFNWLRLFLGARFQGQEWSVLGLRVPSQTNGYDCGMFVITNSIYIALGLDPNSYSQDDMPLQRRRIAAMLLNGGFTGPFDLSHL